MVEINNMPPTYQVFAQEHLEAMYPDIYNRVYPTVQMCCEIYDVPSNPGFYPYPTRAAVEQMTEYIYQNVATAAEPQVNQEFGYGYGGYGYGGGFLRPLITILLIRELLRRRRPYYY